MKQLFSPPTLVFTDASSHSPHHKHPPSLDCLTFYCAYTCDVQVFLNSGPAWPSSLGGVGAVSSSRVTSSPFLFKYRNIFVHSVDIFLVLEDGPFNYPTRKKRLGLIKAFTSTSFVWSMKQVRQVLSLHPLPKLNRDPSSQRYCRGDHWLGLYSPSPQTLPAHYCTWTSLAAPAGTCRWHSPARMHFTCIDVITN